MRRLRRGVSIVVSVFAATVPGSTISAQDWFVDATFDQSFSGSDPLRTPSGFSVSGGAVALWGPIGVHAIYRDLSEGGDDVVLDCAGATSPCVPGALGVSYEMRTAGVGISYDFINPTDVMLTLALIGTRNWRRERMTHRVTGQPYDHDLSTSLGLSASAHLRLRPLVRGLRPEVAVRYDYTSRGACAEGAACWQRHRAFGVSVGFSWVLRTQRADRPY